MLLIEDKCWFSPIYDSGLILTPRYGDSDSTLYSIEFQEGNTDNRSFKDIIKNNISLQYKITQRNKVLHEKRMLEYKSRRNNPNVEIKLFSNVIEPTSFKIKQGSQK